MGISSFVLKTGGKAMWMQFVFKFGWFWRKCKVCKEKTKERMNHRVTITVPCGYRTVKTLEFLTGKWLPLCRDCHDRWCGAASCFTDFESGKNWRSSNIMKEVHATHSHGIR